LNNKKGVANPFLHTLVVLGLRTQHLMLSKGYFEILSLILMGVGFGDPTPHSVLM